MAFVVALNHLYWVMRAVLYQRIAIAIETTRECGTFFIVFCLLSPWRPPGQYDINTRPMAASSGFGGGHGHAALGNVCNVALAHQQGHQNGSCRRCSFIASLILLSTITVANNPVMVH